jgi:hypothetical protein
VRRESRAVVFQSGLPAAAASTIAAWDAVVRAVTLGPEGTFRHALGARSGYSVGIARVSIELAYTTTMLRSSASVPGSPTALGGDAAAPTEPEATSNAGDDGHIQTLPFGTKRALSSLPPAVQAPPPFRFLITQPPTAARQHETSDAHSQFTVPPAEQPKPSPRSRWLLLLGAIGLTLFAFAWLIWPDPSNTVQEASLPRQAAPNAPRMAPSSPAPTAVGTDTASEPGTWGESPAQQISEPSRAANATTEPNRAANATTLSRSTTRPQSSTGEQLPLAKARATLKRGSVLAAVLAPPPAD